MKKLLIWLGISKPVNKVNYFTVDKSGYRELMDEEYTLYGIARSYVLDYAQPWDDEKHKQDGLQEVLAYSVIPFRMPQKRSMLLLKRDFKKALRAVDCTLTAEDDNYMKAVTKVANILKEFKYRSRELRQSYKK